MSNHRLSQTELSVCERMESGRDADATTHNTLIVVLGMHRSGTSVITRAMETLGAEFGENLNPPAPEINEKGFFEDLDIHAINVEILQAAHADWCSLEPVELNRLDKEVLAGLRTRAIEVLREKCKSRIFAVKDPRISRLLSFWQPVFRAVKVRVKYIVAIRNPISVSRSLDKRDQFPQEKSYLLWLAHTVAALQQTEGLPRSLVEYDRLMEQPRVELERISREMNLPLDLSRIDEFEQEFLDNGLRHARFEAQDLDVVSAAPHQVRDLFSALAGASLAEGGRLPPALRAALIAAQNYLDDIAPILHYVSGVEQSMQNLRDEHGARHQDIENLQHALNESGARATLDQSKLEQLAREKAELQAALDGVTATIQQTTRDTLDTMAASIRALEDSTAARQTALDAMAMNVQSLESSLAEQRAALDHANSIVAGLLQSTSWRITAPLRGIRRLFSRRDRLVHSRRLSEE